MYKILSFLHKPTGSLLCLLFFMWFTSGIVLSVRWVARGLRRLFKRK